MNKLLIPGTRFEVHDVPAIYFLFKDDELVYIGQSTCLHARLGQHMRDKEFTHYTCVYCHKDELDRLEAAYIDRYRPLLNAIGVNLQNQTKSLVINRLGRIMNLKRCIHPSGVRPIKRALNNNSLI